MARTDNPEGIKAQFIPSLFKKQSPKQTFRRFMLCNDNHQQCWWDKKALAMRRKKYPPLI